MKFSLEGMKYAVYWGGVFTFVNMGGGNMVDTKLIYLWCFINGNYVYSTFLE